jgi:L-arabinokinase
VIKRELGFEFRHGARLLISSQIPIGKGVSSSAALEVAAMQAVCSAFDIRIEPLQLALLCQKLENRMVGAPCGVMDQITAHCGVKDSLLSLLCQPVEILGNVVIPDQFEFWGMIPVYGTLAVQTTHPSDRYVYWLPIVTDLAGLK